MSGMTLDVLNLPQVREALRSRPELARAALDKAVEAGALVVKAAMIARGPGPEIDYQKVDEAVYHIGPVKRKFFYTFLEKGTQPHMIRPRRKRALHWGEGAFSAGHMVGGIQARPFMRPAVDENRDQIGSAAGAVLREAITRR